MLQQEQRCVTVLVQDGIYVNFQGVSGLLETFQFMQQLQGLWTITVYMIQDSFILSRAAKAPQDKCTLHSAA